MSFGVFKALEIDGLSSTCFKYGVIKEEMGMGLKVEKGGDGDHE